MSYILESLSQLFGRAPSRPVPEQIPPEVREIYRVKRQHRLTKADLLGARLEHKSSCCNKWQRRRWATLIGVDPESYGTHSLRRTKATLTYRQTKNLRAVQLLLGHRTLESTVRYLGIELDDALELAEQTEV